MNLEPCPFCGGEARIVHRSKSVENGEFRCVWEVGCNKCYTKKSYESFYVLTDEGEFVTKFDGREKAIREWNRRA